MSTRPSWSFVGIVRVAILICLAQAAWAEEDVGSLLKRLETAKPAERPAIVASLRAAGEKTIRVLAGQLASQDPVAQFQAAQLLGELRLPDAVTPLAQALKSPHVTTRAAAAKALAAIGSKEAVPALCEALNDPFYAVRLEAVSALAALSDPQALDPLKAVLAKDHKDASGTPATAVLYDGRSTYTRTPVPDIWLKACDALVRIGEPALPALRQTLNAAQPELRSRAASALLSLRDTPSLPQILQLLQSNVLPLTPETCALLGRTQSPLVVPPLLRGLDSQNAAARDASAIALGNAGDRSVVPVLVRAYETGKLGTSALTALAQLADFSTEGLFIKALDGKDPGALAMAIGALEKVGTGKCFTELLPFCSDRNASITAAARRSLAAALSRAAATGEPSAVPTAAEALKIGDRTLSTAACQVFSSLGGKAEAGYLTKLLQDKDTTLHRLAAQALESMAERVRVPLWTLFPGFSHADRTVQDTCVRAAKVAVRDLSADEKSPLLPELVALVEDQSPSARAVAAFGLGEVGDDRSIPYLLRLLTDKDRSVAAEAVRVLELITDLDYGADKARWENWWRLREASVLAAKAVPFEESRLAFTPVASIRLPYGSPQAVAMDSRYAFLANGDGGLVVLDVRKPDSPAAVGQLPTGGNSQLGIVDQWWAREVFQKAFALAVSGSELYLATQSKGYDVDDVHVYRIDVSAPTAPRILDTQWFGGGVPKAVRVQGTRVLVLAEGVLTALDFRDQGRPARPVQWARKQEKKAVKAVGFDIGGDRAFVVDEQGEFTVRSLEDITKEIGGLQVAETAADLCVLGESAVVASKSKLLFVDVGKPASLAVSGELALPDEEVLELGAAENRIFARAKSGALYEIDARKASKPRATRLLQGLAGSFAIQKATACLVTPGFGVKFVDLRKPERPPAQVRTTGEFHNFVKLGDGRLVCSLGPGGLALVPANLDSPPQLLAAEGVTDVVSVFAAEGKLYLSTNRGMVILSETGGKVGAFLPSKAIPDLKPRPGEDAASLDSVVFTYVMVGRAYLLNVPAGLMIVDVSEPAAPRLLGRYDTERNVHNHVWGDNAPEWINERNTPQSVLVAGDRAYVAMGRSGLYVLDVANPQAPKFLGGFFDRSVGKMSACRVWLDANRLYLSDLDSGIYVLDVADPAGIRALEHFHTANAHGFAVSDKAIVVADGGYGLRAIRRTQPLSFAGSYHASRIWFRDVMFDGEQLIVGDRAGIHRFGMKEEARTLRTAFQLEQPLAKPDGKPLTPQEVKDLYGTAYRIEVEGVDVASAAYQGHEGHQNRLIPVCQDLSDEAGFPKIEVQSQTVAIDPARGRIKFSDGDRKPIRGLGKLPLTMGIPCRVLLRGSLLFSINEEGLNLRCYDVSDPLKPRLRSAIATGGFSCHGLTAKGPYVGASNNLSAFTVYDFSDPDNPVHASFIGPCSARGMEFDDGDRLYCVHGRCLIVDVKDIRKPKVLGVIPECHSSRFCARGDFLYMPSGEGLVIYNVRDPGNVTKAAVYPGAWAEPVPKDGLLYLAGASFDIVDVKNPAAPAKLASLPLQAKNLAIDRTFAYLAEGNTLHVLDISKPTAPTVLASLTGLPDKSGGSNGEVNSIAVSEDGDTLFVGLMWNGFVVIDVRDKVKPRIVSGRHDTSGDYTGIVVEDDRAYIGMNWGALYIADVSDPAKPALIGDTRRLVDGATGPHLHGKTVYFSGFENRPTLRIVDARNPADPKLLSEWQVPGTWYDTRRGGGSFAHRFGKYLVLPWACATLDVSDPAAPRLVGTLPDREPHHQKVLVRGDYAYLTSYKGWSQSVFRVVSLRDPKRPEVVGTLNADISGGYYFGHGVTLRGNTLYGLSYGPFLIVDVSDPAKPTILSATELRGFGSDCFINYPYAYVAMYYGALNILDVSDPRNPVLIDWVGYGGYQDEAGWDNLGCYQSVATYRGTAYVTEYYTGLMTFDVPTPNQEPKGGLTVRLQAPAR